MSLVSTEIIQNVERLAAYVPEWRALWRRSANATPFQSPDWLLPWWDVFAPGELRCIAVGRGGSLAALAPLYREDGTHGARLLPVGVSLSDYLDVLIDPAYPDSVNELSGAIAEMVDVDAVEWGEVRPGAHALRLAAPNGWEAGKATASPCPVVDLPDRPEGLRNVLSQSRWRHLRTASNRAARRGETVIIQGDMDNAGALLNELVRLHKASRAQRGGDVFSDLRVAEFHASALPELVNQGIVRLYALSIGGQIAAVYYGFQHCERAYAYQCGYDPAFTFESPGTILIAHAMNEAITEGAREFHFLRGNEPYKYEWGARDRINLCYKLLRRQQQRRAYG
jgi:CelD/BcsL family acetyltransferase involved in cellulose biosynthesis